MKKFLFFVIAILCLASCGNNDPKSELTLQQTFISRTFMEGSTAVEVTEGDYTFVLDLVNMRINITANKAVIPGLAEATTFTLHNIPLKFTTQNGYTFESASVIPTINGVENPEFKITNLKGKIYESEVRLEYNVPGNYKIIGTQKEMIFMHSVTTTNKIGSQDAPYKYKLSAYHILFNAEKRTAKVIIRYAKFAENMPVIEMMEISDVPFEATPTTFTLKADEVIPTISSVPYPKYAITKLTALIAEPILNMSFICGGIYNTSVSASMHNMEIE